MKWWYENDRVEKAGMSDEYCDVLFSVALDVRNYFEKHNAPNYYIYNEHGLFKIIKGSEFDPFSISRHNPQSKKKNIILGFIPEELETELDFYRLYDIAEGSYKWTKEQLMEIKRIMEVNIDTGLFLDEVIIKEYNIKKDIGDVWCAYQCGSHNIPTNILTTKDLTDISNIPVILDFLYDLDRIDKTYFIFAYKKNEFIGYFVIRDLETCNIYSTLLLIGADQFVFVLYDAYSSIKLSNDDFLRGVTFKKTSSYLGLNYADYVFINKENYRSVKEDINEIIKKKVRVNDYYSANYYFNLDRKEITWNQKGA